MSKITIDVKEFMSTQTDPKYTAAQHHVMDRVKEIILENRWRVMTTNGNIASVFQDAEGYKFPGFPAQTMSGGTPSPYPMGTLWGVHLMVDPYMRWDDNRIRCTDRTAPRAAKIRGLLGECQGFVDEILIVDPDMCLI